MLRLLYRVSLPQLRASWGRTLLVVGGVATGVALIVAINVINTSVLANFRDTIDLIAGPAQLEITLGLGEIGFDESITGIVLADPQVVAAIPLVRGTISLADDAAETLQLFGADLTRKEDLARYRLRLADEPTGDLEWLNDPSSIALTTVFAERHGIAAGQSLELSTPQGVHTFTVRGLLEAEGLARAFGGQLAVMDLQAAQELLGKGARIDQVDVIVRQDAEVDPLRARLAAALPPTLTVAPPDQRSAVYDRIFASFQGLLTGLSLLCLVAGIYIIYNTTSTGAVQRALVMAALQLTGADAGQLFRLLMVEAIVLGAVGTVVGMAGGVVLGRLLTGMVSESMGVIYQLRVSVEALTIDWRQQVFIAVVGVTSALFASYFAARRITSMEPLAVLRSDPASLAPKPPIRRFLLGWLALVVVSAIALTLEVHYKAIAWGNVGSTLWFGSSIVIAIPLVTASGRVVSQILSRMFAAEGRFAAESLFRSPTRTGVTVAAIALVITIAITFASAAMSHRNSVRGYFEGGFLASDLTVNSVATEGGWLWTPLPETVATEIAEIRGVRAAESLRILPGQLHQGIRIAVAGLTDGVLQPERFPRQWFRAGEPVAATSGVRSGAGAVVSISLADRLNLNLGDTLTLDTPTKALPLRVVGIVRDYISDRGTVIVSRRVLAEHWRDGMINWVNVFLDGQVPLEEVRSAIKARLGGRYRVNVLNLQEGLDYLGEKIDRAYGFTAAIQLLIIIVTVAGIFDLLIAAIWERRRELALWRVIGADERAVRRSVVIESLTIGTLGALLGIAVGFVTAWIWTGVNYRYLLGYYIDYQFALGAAVRFALLAIAMTIVAGAGAARYATRQSVLAGIQVE